MIQIKKAISKYNELPVPVRASFWFIVMSVLQKGIIFLVTPVYTRMLSKSEYGYYSLYSSWLSLFGVFATLNLTAGVFSNGMLKYEDKRQEFISSMQGLSTLTTTVVAILVFVFTKFMRNYTGLDDITIFVMFLALLFSQSYGFWTEYQRYNLHYKELVLLSIGMAVCIPCVSIVLIYVMPEKKYAVVFGSALVQTIVGIIFYAYNLVKGKKLVNREFWIFALKFNIPLIPHYLSYMILGQSDRLMINSFCGSEDLAVYSLAYNISLLVNIVVSAINSVYTPWVYRKMKSGGIDVISKYSIYMLIFMAIVTISGVLVAPELIVFLGSNGYQEAQAVVPPVMLGCFFIMIFNFFGVIEFYYEKSAYVMIGTCTAAMSNIILNLLFIPIYGYIAAAYTTLASYAIMALLNYYVMNRFCKNKGLPNCYDAKKIFGIAIVVTTICILISQLYSLTIIRYLIVVVTIAVVIIRRDWVRNVLSKILDKPQ